MKVFAGLVGQRPFEENHKNSLECLLCRERMFRKGLGVHDALHRVEKDELEQLRVDVRPKEPFLLCLRKHCIELAENVFTSERFDFFPERRGKTLHVSHKLRAESADELADERQEFRHLLRERLVGRNDGIDLLLYSRHHHLHDGFEQFVLARKKLVNSLLAHSKFGGNLIKCDF